MQIRIIIIGEDNQSHPYEFKSYEDAISFLQGKVLKSVDEVVDKLVKDIPDESKEWIGEDKKEDLLVE